MRCRVQPGGGGKVEGFSVCDLRVIIAGAGV